MGKEFESEVFKVYCKMPLLRQKHRQKQRRMLMRIWNKGLQRGARRHQSEGPWDNRVHGVRLAAATAAVGKVGHSCKIHLQGGPCGNGLLNARIMTPAKVMQNGLLALLALLL